MSVVVDVAIRLSVRRMVVRPNTGLRYVFTPFYWSLRYSIYDSKLFLDQRIFKGLIVTLHLIFDCKSNKKSTACLFFFASIFRNSSQLEWLQLAVLDCLIVGILSNMSDDFLYESQEEEVSLCLWKWFGPEDVITIFSCLLLCFFLLDCPLSSLLFLLPKR